MNDSTGVAGRLAWMVVMAGGLGVGGCAGPTDEPDEVVGSSSEAIESEIPGEVEVIERQYLSADPEVLRTSYAAPTATVAGNQECSATMISPHVVMTAGHCNAGLDGVVFTTYSALSATARHQDPYACTTILRQWDPTIDFQLLYCGEGPGTHFGYVDLDHTPITVGRPLYSHWSRAGHVVRSPSVTQGNDWSLSSRALAIPKNHVTQICFEAKQLGTNNPLALYGTIRVLVGSTEITRKSFRPTTSWGTQVCTEPFVPASNDVAVMFGVDTPAPTPKTPVPQYLVDAVRVTSQ